MKFKLAVLGLMAIVLLAGCKGGADFSSLFDFGGSSGNDDIVIANLPGGGGSDDGGSSDNPGGGLINPEPATLALLGSGLFAYALLRRRKKR